MSFETVDVVPAGMHWSSKTFEGENNIVANRDTSQV